MRGIDFKSDRNSLEREILLKNSLTLSCPNIALSIPGGAMKERDRHADRGISRKKINYRLMVEVAQPMVRMKPSLSGMEGSSIWESWRTRLEKLIGVRPGNCVYPSHGKP